MLQIGAALSNYKLGKTFLQIGVAHLLLTGASATTNWGSYCKLGKPLLQNGTGITNWGNCYKFGHNNCTLLNEEKYVIQIYID